MQEYTPLVSIIIPVYNGANYMREAIDSAIAQTYDNIEIIVVNDGSTDDGETERIALSYGDKIKYYKKENGGCASALNYGINKMQGEWFSWLSHDDVYMPEKVKASVDIIKNNNLNTEKTIVMCATEVIDSEGKPLLSPGFGNNNKFWQGDTMFQKFMRGQSLNGCALLIPKKALDEIGPFSTDYIYILDWMYWVEMSIRGYDFFYLPDKLVKNRMHQAQVSVQKRHLWNTETERFLCDLVDRLQHDQTKLAQIWLYAYRIGMKSCCEKVKSFTKIRFAILIKGIKNRLKYKIRTLVRNIVRKLGH